MYIKELRDRAHSRHSNTEKKIQSSIFRTYHFQLGQGLIEECSVFTKAIVISKPIYISFSLPIPSFVVHSSSWICNKLSHSEKKIKNTKKPFSLENF
jgi:hypothetical protein